jgi:uncharacterized protein (DUF305 family)
MRTDASDLNETSPPGVSLMMSIYPDHAPVPLLAGFLFAATLVACGTGARSSVDPSYPISNGYTEADVRFMRGMIPHHAQALNMTGLVAERTTNEDIRRLAHRIEISQRDEIARMRRWLEARGELVPGEHHRGPLMPGMLTEEEMAQLSAARGSEFDRLFLELMIHHHEGALVMVDDLFTTDGAGQEAEIFLFASHVDSDQRAEIARMRGMLNSTTSQGGTP